jgi:DNA-directed RNA polymerase subunit RPC12/RpoP
VGHVKGTVEVTIEKKKRNHCLHPHAYKHGHFSRREVRKYIRSERKSVRLMIKKGKLRNRERFVCNHCGKPIRLEDWLWEQGGVIRCPECIDWIMDIEFLNRIIIEAPMAKRAFLYGKRR